MARFRANGADLSAIRPQGIERDAVPVEHNVAVQQLSWLECFDHGTDAAWVWTLRASPH